MTENSTDREPKLVAVLETNSITEALLAKGLIEAEGVAVDYVSYGVPELTATMMGARLLVSSEDEARAREVLADRQPLPDEDESQPKDGNIA
jgi:hypothetical protein